MPATKATGRLTIPPIKAASRARRKSPGERTWVRVLVWLGEARMAVKAESAPAKVQATVEVRRTQTPDEPGRLGVLGRGPHGQAPVGEPDEGGQSEGHDGRHDQGDDVTGGEAGTTRCERTSRPAPGRPGRASWVG